MMAPFLDQSIDAMGGVKNQVPSKNGNRKQSYDNG